MSDGHEAYEKNNEVKKGRSIRVLLLVGVINVLITCFFGTLILYQIIIGKNPNSNKTEITAEYTDGIVDQLVQYYNNNDYEGMYTIFGDYAKTKVSLQDAKNAMKNLTILGKISNWTFQNSSILGTDEIGTWIEVNYSAMFESGSGIIKLSILERNKQKEVVGYNFNISNMK